jgi:hypothetical protein
MQSAVHPARELVQAPSRDPSPVVTAEAVSMAVARRLFVVLVAVAVLVVQAVV